VFRQFAETAKLMRAEHQNAPVGRDEKRSVILAHEKISLKNIRHQIRLDTFVVVTAVGRGFLQGGAESVDVVFPVLIRADGCAVNSAAAAEPEFPETGSRP
jgi:hypothetical protein